MKSFSLLLIISITLFTTAPIAQVTPVIKKAVYFDKTPPLREMQLIEPSTRDRSWKDKVVRNEEKERKFNNNPAPLPIDADPAWQKEFGFRQGNEIISNFDGVPNLNDVYPPDTDGDVGPDHYFQMINLSFQIFDKEGNSLYGPADNRTLWSGFIGPWTGTNDGDPIVIYDEEADRWVASQFAIHTQDGTFWELVAVSETGDPTGGYFRYAFEFPAFNDYPKLGVWPDGYYFSFNMFGSDYFRGAVCSLERDAMLAGNPDARMILFDLPEGSEPASLLPADFDGPVPPDGEPNYFAYVLDDAFEEGDILSIWALKSDWENPDNSTFEEVNRLSTEPFNSWFCNGSLGTCLPQPDSGPYLEVLSDRLMYRLQYRNFGTYQAMVTNHTVNVDGNGHAGVRWYELRDYNDGNGWVIYQQGTYAPDEYHRWMGSVAMDGRGYIALGFSIVNQNRYASICYTGRSPNDPLGQMTFYEEEIMAGTGIQTGSVARWGDYSMMSVDPANDTTFWFTTEYIRVSGTVSWRTRIAGFTMIEDHVAPNDLTDLTATSNPTNSVTLNWTATGDNGSEGTAFIYDIRYSTEEITEENFETATQAEKEPAPAEAGTTESFTVKNLEFDTDYYLAMKVRDKQFNYSGKSNVVQASTPSAPQIMLEDYSLEQKMFPGSTGSRPYSLQNNGGSDLYFEIHKDTLDVVKRNRDAGDILGTYTGSSKAISGMAWVENVLYMTDMEKDYLLKYDTALQAVTDTMLIHDTPFSMVYDGELLWIGDKSGNVIAYTTDGIPAGFSFTCPHAGFSTLAWDGQYFLANFVMDNNPVISRVDQTGQVINSFKAFINNMEIWQLVYVPEHHDGHFWFTNNSGKIGQISENEEEGTGSLLKVLTAPSIASYALAHDHTDLWYGKIGGTLYRIEDGTDEVGWLKINPEKGMIGAVSQVELELDFDAGDFSEGNYRANMIVLTNDPVAAEIRVPVDMQVTGGISIGPDTSFCGHLALTLDAGEGFAGYRWSDGSAGQTLQVDSTGYGAGQELIWVEVTDIGGVSKRDSISVNFLDCSSIFEFADGVKVMIYPNPNHGIFEIRAENLADQLFVTISDMAGNIVVQKNLIASQDKVQILKIDLNAQASGSYILRLSTEGRIKVEKIIVN
jgi:hypothetical protein